MFAHLHLHSEYSYLDGLGKAKSYARQANKKNIYAIAKFYDKEKKGEITLKKIEKVGSTVILIPSNIEYDIQVYHKSEIQVLGKVIRVLRALQ